MRLLRWMRFRAATPTSHEHYCDACDRHWPHGGEDGRSCTRYWDWRCEGCRSGPSPDAPRPAGETFELRFTIE